MIARWVLQTALVMITVSCGLYIKVLQQQVRTFAKHSSLQPLKWLLFGAVILLILGALPLGLEYANILWWHHYDRWTAETAILANAIAKVVVGVMLYQIYRFREKRNDDDSL